MQVRRQGHRPSLVGAGPWWLPGGRVQQPLCTGVLGPEPLQIVTVDTAAMPTGEIGRLQPVVGRWKIGEASATPQVAGLGEVCRVNVLLRGAGRETVHAQVDFADAVSAVAGPAQRLGERRDTGVEVNPVGAYPVTARGQPGVERGARRHAERVGDVGAGAVDTAGRQGVEVRRPQDGMTGAAEMIGTLLIGHQEEEVGPCSHHHRSSGVGPNPRPLPWQLTPVPFPGREGESARFPACSHFPEGRGLGVGVLLPG